MPIKVQEKECKTAISKCGFPGGGWAINPYVGCSHNCLYCYARFIKRFSGHTEDWGSFVDARINIAEVLKKQIKNPKFHQGQIYISTVTDPYQQAEEKYELTRQILEVLVNYPVSVSLLTKSDLVLRDLDLIKKLHKVDVNFTINTLDDDWKNLIEPNSPSVAKRLEAAKKLTSEGITVYAMMGPYWPFFTDPEKLFAKFKEAGISQVFTESFNTTGGNFTQVEAVLTRHYPDILPSIKRMLFDSQLFCDFYGEQEEKLKKLYGRYKLPISIYFGQGHAGKFGS